MTQTLEKKKYSIKTDFSLLSILLIPIGVALNVVGDQLVAALSLPLYLDSFGAVLAGYLAGPWVGMLTGVLTNVLTGIIRNPTLLPYAITNGCTGLMAGLFARAQWPNGKFWKVALMLLIMSIGTICTSAPISVFAYGGISGNGGSSVAIAGLVAAGANIWKTVLSVDGIVTVFDRIVSHILCYLIILVIPQRTLIKYSCGEQWIRKNKKAVVEDDEE